MDPIDPPDDDDPPAWEDASDLDDSEIDYEET